MVRGRKNQGTKKKRKQQGLQTPRGVVKGEASRRETGKQESPGLVIEYGARRGRLDRRGLSEMPPRLEAEQIEALGTGDLGEGMGKGRGKGGASFQISVADGGRWVERGLGGQERTLANANIWGPGWQ